MWLWDCITYMSVSQLYRRQLRDDPYKMDSPIKFFVVKEIESTAFKVMLLAFTIRSNINVINSITVKVKIICLHTYLVSEK